MNKILERMLFGKASFQEDQWLQREPSSYPMALPYLGTYLKIYKSQVAVRALVHFRAINAAAVPVKVFTRNDQDVETALRDHGLSLTLRDPNPETTQFEFVRDLWTDLDLFDCTFWRKYRVRGNLLLVRMFPDSIEFKGGNSLAPEQFIETQADGNKVAHDRADVFWLNGYGGYRGVAPLETLRRELVLDEAETRHREKLARSGWRNAGIIERPADADDWNDKSRRRFLEAASSRYSGEGDMAGRHLLLEEGMTYKNDGLDLKTDEYVASRTFTLKQVCLAFHMTPQLLGIDGAPYSSLIEYKNQLYQVNLGPEFNHVEQGFEKQLLPEFEKTREDRKGIFVEFNIPAMLRGDPVTQASIGSQVVNTTLDVNEWRAMVYHLPPLTQEQIDRMMMFKGGGASVGAPAPTEEPQYDPYATPSPSDLLGLSDGAVEVKQAEVVDIVDKAWEPLKKAADAEVSPQEYQQLMEQHAYQMKQNMKALFAKWRTGYGAVAAVPQTEWTKSLGGDMHLILLAATMALGKLIATKIKGEYDAGRTVNYINKVANEEAKALVSQLTKDIDATGPELAFDMLNKSADQVSTRLMTRFSGWTMMETLTQNGVDEEIK